MAHRAARVPVEAQVAHVAVPIHRAIRSSPTRPRPDPRRPTRLALTVGPFALVVAWVAALLSPVAGDFFQFWFAGHLVATGSSPYDQAEWVGAYSRFGELASVVRHNCPTVDAPACRWAYPPWTAWLLAPFGMLDPLRGIALEGITFLAVLVAGVLVVVRSARIQPDWLCALVLFGVAMSPPFLTDAISGHFDGLMLIGLALLASGLADRRALPLALAAMILALKPHVALAVGPLVLVWLLRERQPLLLMAPTAILVALAVVGFGSDPRALPALSGAGSKIQLAGSTTWSFASLAGSLAPVAAAALLVVSAVAAGVALRLSSADRRAQVFVASAAALSLVVAPYLHLYDHLLLVPAVVISVSLSSAKVGSPGAVAILVAFVAAGWVAHTFGRTLAGIIPVAALVVLAVTTYLARSGPAGRSGGLRSG